MARWTSSLLARASIVTTYSLRRKISSTGLVKVDDAVDVVTLEEKLGLPLVAGEAVDHEAEVPVVLGEAVLYHAFGEVVADQFAGRHRAPHLRPELRVVLHVPPEDVSDGDVHEVEVARQQ